MYLNELVLLDTGQIGKDHVVMRLIRKAPFSQEPGSHDKMVTVCWEVILVGFGRLRIVIEAEKYVSNLNIQSRNLRSKYSY